MKTVIGIDNIIPGTPQMNPQNISITKTVMILIEKDFPINIGSKIEPNSTWAPVIEMIKKARWLPGSNSTKAKIVSIITVINEPIIWIKLITKAKIPQKIGKLTSKEIQAKNGQKLSSGYISLQSESHPIEFKNIEILEL